MMKLNKYFMAAFICVGLCVIFAFCDNSSPVNSSDLVPDKETATKIAEAIWLPIYGKDVLDEKPFVATLKDDSVWVVEGTLHSKLGGVAYIEINKKNCMILEVTHGK